MADGSGSNSNRREGERNRDSSGFGAEHRVVLPDVHIFFTIYLIDRTVDVEMLSDLALPSFALLSEARYMLSAQLNTFP